MASPNIEFWFHKPSGTLEIVNLRNGKHWVFQLVRKEKEDRFDYTRDDFENLIDLEDFFGSNGYTRMRIWEKELKFDIDDL